MLCRPLVRLRHAVGRVWWWLLPDQQQPVPASGKQTWSRRCALTVVLSLLGGLLLLLSAHLEPDLRLLYEQLPQGEDCGPDTPIRSRDTALTRRLREAEDHSRQVQEQPGSVVVLPIGLQVSESRPLTDDWKSWRPNQTQLEVLYQHLDVSLDQVASHLPLTLQGPDRLDNRSLCWTPDGEPPDIVFLVHSATDHSERRLIMRSTFLNSTFYPGWQVRALFLLGETTDSSVQRALEAEHAQYGDLLQGQFLDAYVNITHKAVLGLRWLYDHCSGVRVVVKLDDDVFLDPFKLRRRYWSLVVKGSRSIWCSVRTQAPVHRAGKWAIDHRLFPQTEYYPYTVCLGIGVIFTGDMLPSLLAAARYAPLFWVDDIYVYGMLPHLSQKVRYHHLGYERNVIMHDASQAEKCLRDLACPMLVSDTASIRQLQRFWHHALLAERVWTEMCKVVPSLVQQPGDLAVWTVPLVQL